MQVLFKQQDWAAEDWGVDQEPLAFRSRKVAEDVFAWTRRCNQGADAYYSDDPFFGPVQCV